MSVTILSGLGCEYLLPSGVKCGVCNAGFNIPCLSNFRQLCWEITPDYDLERTYRCYTCCFYDDVFIHNASKLDVNRLENMLADAIDIAFRDKEPIEKMIDHVNRDDFMKQLKSPTACSLCLIEESGKLLCECGRIAYCNEECKSRHVQQHKDDCIKFRTYPLLKTIHQQYIEIIEIKTKELDYHLKAVARLQDEIATLKEKL